MADVQPNVDFAQQVLAPLSVDQDTKAQAWEAYHNASSLQDFTQKIGALNLPQDAKADLWEGANMRFNGAASAPAVPRPVPQMQESTLGNAYSVAQTGGASNAAPASRGAALQQQTAGIEDTLGGKVATGALDEGLQTVHTGLAAGSRVLPGVQNIPFKEPEQLQSQGTAENVGAGIMAAIEMASAESGIKALSLGEKLGLASQVAKLAEKHPVIARIVDAGANSLRAAAASGAQSAVHNDSFLGGAAAGGIGGAIGEGLGAAGEALFPRTKAAAEAAVNADLNKGTLMRQFAAEGTANAAKSAAENAGAEVPKINFDAWRKQGVPLPSNGIDSFRDAANSIRKTYDPVFDKLREATGGVLNTATGRYEGSAFDELNNQIRRAKKVIFSPTPASTDALKTAEEELADGQTKLEQLFNSNGQVSKEDLATARKAWKTAATLDDLHNQLDKAFTEPAGSRDISRRMAEVNPQKFVARMNTAIDRIGANDLKAALGDHSFANLMVIRQSMDTLVQNKKFSQEITKGVRAYLREHGVSPLEKTFGGPVLGAAASTVAHFAGASNPVTAGLGLTVAAIHWMYTHPDAGVAILRNIAPLVQPATQIAKHSLITHVFNPITGEAEPLQ